jgi:bifunctional enzyme CysN/CysC
LTDLLRFLTAGSVDDGKSTLTGRLLYDAGGVYEDQLSSVRKASSASPGSLDLSLITDGLKAEREQAITIDVAYRYFATSRRKFIIADAPGHEQYTRNMVTAASTSDLALILVDARKGVLEQTRRHAYIASLLGIREMIIAVNKMDLVGFNPERFQEICESFRQLAIPTPDTHYHFVPISALHGQNVVAAGRSLEWYSGPTLLRLLETVQFGQDDQASLRFPVQQVIRVGQDFRGYAGQTVSGRAHLDQEVLALPSRHRTRISEILLHRKKVSSTVGRQPVVLSLANQLDVSRGDMLVDAAHLPCVSDRVVANLIWLSQLPLLVDTPYLIRHTTQTLCGSFRRVFHKLDVNTFQECESPTLQLNDIGKVMLETHKPMFCETYLTNRALGSFIAIDPVTNFTVAGGMISDTLPARTDALSYSIAGHGYSDRAKGLTVWFTGLSGAGKTTICKLVHTELLARGIQTEILDGDVIRQHLNSDLGFSKEDRDENIRRIGFVANLLTRNGVVVLVAAISPYRAVRDEVKRTIPSFREVHVNAPLDVCEQRDPKGLYKRARKGEISAFTGVSDAYEIPLSPDLRCDTHLESAKACVDKVVALIVEYLNTREKPAKGSIC